MSRCNTIIAAALTAAALAAPLAQPPDSHAGLSEPAPEAHSKQDLRTPDTRDAARAATPSDRNAARPETAGNPNISADAAPSAPATNDSKHATTDHNTPAEERALAQERYYSSYDRSSPPTSDRALAQERYYSSHDRAAPLRRPVRPALRARDDGQAWPSIAIAVAITGLVAAGAAALSRPRRSRLAA